MFAHNLSSRYNHYMKSQLPNILTWIRIVLIPVFVIIFFSDLEYARPISGVIFAIAGFTDWLDGTLARRWGQTSNFGAFLDPVADKLMVSTALILLISYDQDILLVLAAIIIIGREIAVSALREWMAGLGLRNAVKVHAIGKLKTIFQMGSLFALLYQFPLLKLPTYQIGYYSLIFAALLTLISMSLYLYSAFTAIKAAE